MRALEARKPGFKFVMPLNGTHSQCISTGHGYLHTQLATFQPKLRTYLHGRLLDCHKIHRMVDDNIVPRTNQSILPRENNFSFNFKKIHIFSLKLLVQIPSKIGIRFIQNIHRQRYVDYSFFNRGFSFLSDFTNFPNCYMDLSKIGEF